MDVTCDLKCPPICVSGPGVAYCCQGCRKHNADHVNDSNSHLWDENGFRGDKGCRLERKDMPARCREYTCKDEIFYRLYFTFAAMVWNGEKWVMPDYIEHFLQGNWKGNEILFKCIRRDIEKGFPFLADEHA